MAEKENWKRFSFSFSGKIAMDAEKFYSSRKWKAKRAAILRRDQYLCKECRKYGRITAATTVHHIIHFDDAPELGLVDSNLVSLCNACHNKAHPEKGSRRGSY